MFDRVTANGSAGRVSGQRAAILRGIYDQNRSLHGAQPRPQPQAAGRGRRWAVPLSGLAMLAAVAHFLDPALQSADPPAAPLTSSPRLAVGSLPPLVPPAPRPAPAAVAVADLAHVAPLAADAKNLRQLFGLAVKTIVIDAGHGGHDPGARGKLGTQEKDITLDVARRLKEKLEATGRYRILLPREDDVFVPLSERAAYANGRQTDLFVSIHVNYLPSTSTNAVETYYFGHHQDARTRRLAERENQGSEYALSEFEDIVRNMQDTIKLQESRALAQSIQARLLTSIRARKQRVLDNGVRTAPFVVLLGVKAPSVLVEIGSLSSPDAERKLRGEAYRDEIATYVAAGINNYLNQQPQEERKIHEAKSRLAAGQ